MAEASLLTEEAKALVGKELYSITYRVSKEDIHKLAIAIGDLNPLYLDEDTASKSRYGGIIAHPMQYLTNPNGLSPESKLSPDGRPETRRLPIKSNKAMQGEAEIEFLRPIRPGDVITARRKIIEMSDRESSKRGWIAPILFETTYTNQKGEVVVVAKDTYIYF